VCGARAWGGLACTFTYGLPEDDRGEHPKFWGAPIHRAVPCASSGPHLFGAFFGPAYGSFFFSFFFLFFLSFFGQCFFSVSFVFQNISIIKSEGISNFEQISKSE
jgi:hypothetical protein